VSQRYRRAIIRLFPPPEPPGSSSRGGPATASSTSAASSACISGAGGAPPESPARIGSRRPVATTATRRRHHATTLRRRQGRSARAGKPGRWTCGANASLTRSAHHCPIAARGRHRFVQQSPNNCQVTASRRRPAQRRAGSRREPTRSITTTTGESGRRKPDVPAAA